MKKGTIFTLALISFVAGGLTYQLDPSLFCIPGKSSARNSGAKKVNRSKPAGAIPGYNGQTVKGEEWSDSQKLEERLSDQILRGIKGTSKADVQKFIAEEDNRLMLAQWHVANRENAVNSENITKKRDKLTKELEERKKKLAELKARKARAKGSEAKELELEIKQEKELILAQEAELKQPLRSAEVAGDAKGGGDFLNQLTNNLEWMEQIAYSGECDNPGRAMGILKAIADKHPDLAHNRVKRETAAAVAVEWSKSGWDFKKALARADYFINNWEEGRLHPMFDDLPFWQRRIVCGAKGNNGYGEAESLQWQLDNVSLPSEQYSGCCWQCAYRRDNLFGDSIHGSMYYTPYTSTPGSNAAQRTYDVGGVCGSLSHYGAFAAIANGIPALTAGEPYHCAYIVLSNGKWTPGYSLSWKRGLHWTMWNNNHKFAALHMATELNSPEEEAKTRLSNAQVTLGKIHASKGDKAKAGECFAAAVQEQPRNYIAWRDYSNFLKAEKPQDVAAWKQLNNSMCETLVPLYPELAAELMKSFVYPNLKGLNLSGTEMMELYSAFWGAVDKMGPDRWDIESLCGAQADTLKQMGGKVENCNLALYKMVLGKCSNNAVYAPVILSWGNGMASNLKPEMQQNFLKATLDGLSQNGKGDLGADARDKMLGQALSGAAKMRDRNSFQAIGKMLSEKYKKNILPKWEPFPGKLASQGGLLYTSSSSHDDPAAHWGVLEPTGGRFHTGNDENAWVVVEMPKTVYITGVVAISTSGQNVRRLHDMKVQYSESGRDNDWKDAGAFPAPSTKVINRLDLQNSKPRARFIRIIRGGKDFFHLNGIFVYGEQAA